MSLTFRRILYFSFILAFFIITPLVMSYAAGYKIVFSLSEKPLQFQKTGALILNTEPAGAKIFINGVPQAVGLNKLLVNSGLLKEKNNFIKTPAKIKNLMPGDYNVKLEKEGCWSWEKKLAVKAGESTYAEDVNLFKKNLPLSVNSTAVGRHFMSPDKNYLSLADNEGRIFLINLADETEINLNAATLDKNAVWSPDSQKIFFDDKIFDITSAGNPLSLKGYVEDASNFKWEPEGSDALMFVSRGKNKQILSRISLSDFSIKSIFESDQLSDYAVKNKYIFTVSKVGNENRLLIYNFNGAKVSEADLPKSGDYRFMNPYDKFVNLYDSRQKILYLINPNPNFEAVETISNITFYEWIDDDRILYANDFEIWINNVSGGDKYLLTRVGAPISGVFWHPSDNYVIFITNHAINIMELDDREKRNITELISLDSISYPSLGKDGEVIYFSAKIGDRQGLYKMTIQ